MVTRRYDYLPTNWPDGLKTRRERRDQRLGGGKRSLQQRMTWRNLSVPAFKKISRLTMDQRSASYGFPAGLSVRLPVFSYFAQGCQWRPKYIRTYGFRIRYTELVKISLHELSRILPPPVRLKFWQLLISFCDIWSFSADTFYEWPEQQQNPSSSPLRSHTVWVNVSRHTVIWSRG